MTLAIEPGFALAKRARRRAAGRRRSGLGAGRKIRPRRADVARRVGQRRRHGSRRPTTSAPRSLLVSRGEAPLGIVYRSDAIADASVMPVGTFPESTHPPIVYPAALTSRAIAPCGESARVPARPRGTRRIRATGLQRCSIRRPPQPADDRRRQRAADRPPQPEGRADRDAAVAADRARHRARARARTVLGTEPAERRSSTCRSSCRPSSPATCCCGCSDGAAPIGAFLEDTLGLTLAFRWTGAARRGGRHGVPADGARDAPGDRSRRSRARGSGGQPRRAAGVDVRHRDAAARAARRSSPAWCSPSRRRSASSARRSRSSRTFPARRRRSRSRSTASCRRPAATPRRCGWSGGRSGSRARRCSRRRCSRAKMERRRR